MEKNLYERLYFYLKEIAKLEYTAAILDWDRKVYSPSKSDDGKDEIYATIKTKAFNLSISEELGEILEKCISSSEIINEEREIILNIKRSYDINKKIPPDLYEELKKTTARAYNRWTIAKKDNNFVFFKPILSEVIKLIKEIASLYNTENKYDALLDMYEPDITANKIKQINKDLLTFLIPSIKKLSERKSQRLPAGIYQKEEQNNFILNMIKEIGFSLDYGRLDTTVHPFTVTIAPKDVRITIKYDEKNPISAIFSALHEMGHGLFEQNKDEKLKWISPSISFSFGLHESQSRMWENIIGKSYNFWSYFYPKFQKYFPHLNNFSLDSLYEMINYVEPSLIRIDADEVTYNLHIILRFELEEQLINGKLDVSELPEAWNAKMRSYLNITPPNDSLGVLQDVHWSDGLFGYFPSYMLGNIYGAQIYNTADKKLKDCSNYIKKGDFKPILNWFVDNVYKWGLIKNGSSIVKQITQKEPEACFWINYIKNKYQL